MQIVKRAEEKTAVTSWFENAQCTHALSRAVQDQHRAKHAKSYIKLEWHNYKNKIEGAPMTPSQAKTDQVPLAGVDAVAQSLKRRPVDAAVPDCLPLQP